MPSAEAELPRAPDLVRRATDRRLFEQLVDTPALTRAELAERTGISKPTVSEGVRRLAAAGVLAEGAQQSGKRGPAGRFYQLHPRLGVALAVTAGPEGVVVQAYGLDGAPLTRVERPVPASTGSVRLAAVLTAAVQAVLVAHPAPVLGCAVSVAGPVDARTGVPVGLPHAPFPLDGFRPRELVAAVTRSPVTVDNDVNWMALAEQHHGAGRGLHSFLLCYLGAGVGSALVLGGRLVRGSRGLAGELAHVRTTGPAGRSRPLVECFGAWDLLRPGSEAVDVARVQELLLAGDTTARRHASRLVDAVADAICSASALLDPEAVLVGGPWGTAVDLAELLEARVALRAAVPVAVRRTTLGPGAALTGAGVAALRTARAAVVAAL